MGILHDDTTGSREILKIRKLKTYIKKVIHTGIIPQNRGLHDSLHPISNNTLLLRAEVMRLITIVVNPETVSSGINTLINCNFISDNMNISLYSSFLQTKSTFNQKKEYRNLLIYYYSSRNTNAVL